MYKFRHTVKYREGTDSDSTCMDPFLDEPNFRCRKCRIRLFCVNQLESHGDQNLKSYASSPTDLSIYDKCSSWFLRDDEMLPWITESVEKAQWTEGKLYCPKCKSRIGAFDFIHGIQCNCGKFIIPAVWIQRSRVDHILPKSLATSLDIRKPVINPNQSARTHCDTSVAVHNVVDSFSAENQECVCHDNPQHLKEDRDVSQFASSPVSLCCNCTDEGLNEGKDISSHNHYYSGQAECNSHPRVNREPASSSCDIHLPISLERNFSSSLQDTNSCTSTCMSLENGSFINDHCEQCCDVKLHQTSDTRNRNSADGDQRTQTLSYCRVCLDAPLESGSSARGTEHIQNTMGSYEQRSKRKRKGRHHMSLENTDQHLYADLVIEPQVSHHGDQKTFYSCLIVDEGFDETMTGLKVVNREFQDQHCCAVCLDLLYEPFKCSCDHVFCDPCLRQLNFRTGSRGMIRCPLCRQIVQHIIPATELRSEIRSTYDSRILRKRDKAERRAPHRKWPLPANQGPLRGGASRARRSVTLPCVISTFLTCACVYTLVMIALLSNLAGTNVITMY